MFECTPCEFFQSLRRLQMPSQVFKFKNQLPEFASVDFLPGNYRVISCAINTDTNFLRSTFKFLKPMPIRFLGSRRAKTTTISRIPPSTIMILITAI